MFGESPKCLFANTKRVCLFFFFKQWIFFWPLFHKAQLCGVYGLKWSYGQMLQSPLWSFAAPSGLSLVSLLPPWLMPSLRGPWVALSWQVCCGAILFPFFINRFKNGALWDVKMFKTQPWSVLLHNFVPDLFGELLGLHSAACLVVLQTLGPFRTGIHTHDRSWDT